MAGGAARAHGRLVRGAGQLDRHLADSASPGGSEVYPPELLRAVALGLGGRVAEALAVASAEPAATLPPHARPWREWLVARLSRP